MSFEAAILLALLMSVLCLLAGVWIGTVTERASWMRRFGSGQ